MGVARSLDCSPVASRQGSTVCVAPAGEAEPVLPLPAIVQDPVMHGVNGVFAVRGTVPLTAVVIAVALPGVPGGVGIGEIASVTIGG